VVVVAEATKSLQRIAQLLDEQAELQAKTRDALVQ
jgi:hypothetical protein